MRGIFLCAWTSKFTEHDDDHGFSLASTRSRGERAKSGRNSKLEIIKSCDRLLARNDNYSMPFESFFFLLLFHLSAFAAMFAHIATSSIGQTIKLISYWLLSLEVFSRYDVFLTLSSLRSLSLPSSARRIFFLLFYSFHEHNWLCVCFRWN